MEIRRSCDRLISTMGFYWIRALSSNVQNNDMMMSSNGNIFRVTGHLCGEVTGPRWIPRTKASELWCFLLICVWINGWENNREAGDLRRYRDHYEVMVVELYWIVLYRAYSTDCNEGWVTCREIDNLDWHVLGTLLTLLNIILLTFRH